MQCICRNLAASIIEYSSFVIINSQTKMRRIFFLLILLNFTFSFSQIIVQVEDMTFEGPYASAINTPFKGGAFFGNMDTANMVVTFPTTPGLYNVTLFGASSDNTDAKIDLLIDGEKVGVYSFNTPSLVMQTQEIAINSSSTNLNVQLLLTTDNGSNDTFIDAIEIIYLGDLPPPRPDPVIPSQGAYDSGVYRNMFVESGVSETAVEQKMNAIWNQLFVNGDINNERLLYEVGSDMAYILDTGNNDIRSEGQSYGMMICVQLEKKQQFDKLWKWAKTYSQWAPGTSREGLFSWNIDTSSSFNKLDDNSAPDGEEYYVTALFFADALWGSQDYPGPFNSVNDIYDYKGQANYILDNMLNKSLANSGGCPTNLIDLDEKQIVFGICGQSATYTDPSYHIAAFYDIWADVADNNNQLWLDMASTSRTYLLPAASHPTTGLMPDYSTFDGAPTGGQQTFTYDAWRNIMNMAFDFNWYQKESASLRPLIDRQIDFFIGQGNGYGDRFEINGNQIGSNHSSGLVATNAVGALSADDAKVWPFVDELYNTSIPDGQFRYYNGLLYMMSYMHLSGNFKALTNTRTLSIKENELNLELIFYPNPVNNILNIKTNTNVVINRLSFYTISGQLLISKTNNLKQINLEPYSKGVYFLKVETENGILNKRILKK